MGTEEEFGISLFERTAKGMVLTPRGERFLIKAQRVLHATRDLLNHASALQDYLMGTLTVGVNAAPDFLRIPGVLNCLQSEAPGIDIDLTTSSAGHILQALQSKSLSAGFVFGPIPTDPSITTHFLDMVSLTVAALAMWENRVTEVDWPELAQLPWIDAGPDCPFQALIDDLFCKRGLDYQRVTATSDEATRQDLIAAGVGLSLVIPDVITPDVSEENQHATSDSARIALVDVAPHDSKPITTPLSIAHHEAHADDPLLNTLVDAIVATWSS